MNNAFDKLTEFLDQLKLAKIHYSIEFNRDTAIMVIAVVPGERWEVEFFQDGSVEIEIFKSDGKIWDESKISEFRSKFVDTELDS
jgi:hypothetical protein